MDKSPQFNARIDPNVQQAFKNACKKRGQSMTDVVTKFMESYTAAKEIGNTLHMDGTTCPLADLISGLREAVRNTLT